MTETTAHRDPQRVPNGEQPQTLSTAKLRKVYRGRAVVADVSIDVGPGEIVGLLGPNGAGKTTTFYMVVGLTPPDDGSVFLGEDDITELPMYLRAQRGISYLPQEPSIFRKMTVENNLRAVFETLDLSHAEQERRLARAVRTEQPDHLAGCDLEADVFDSASLVEVAGQAAREDGD